MTDPSGPVGHAVQRPDETVTLSEDQVVLIDEVVEASPPTAFDFRVVNDENLGTYDAIVGDREVAGVTYSVTGDNRLVLLGTSVLPEFRKQGIATELIRHVLDDARTQGKTVTILCPIVRTFIEHNPEYADLIDAKHPGVTQRRTHSS
ncbi:GNAT family N-acetyltransferase [Micromonospora sp. NPDC005367]|uniref:GNAT family N-acetyltransferase n=1 Tax=Micromonospora sp. NPDC005367 TaxID=3155590 RepID=UPI0033BA6FF9